MRIPLTPRAAARYVPIMKYAVIFTLLSSILFGCAGGEAPNAEPFRAATFNLRLAPTPTANAWDLRRDAVAELAKKRGFDIFGTQEGFFHQLDDISARTGFKYIGKGRDDGARGGETSAIFYNPARFELLDSGDFWFAPTPDKPVKGWDAVCKRICSWGKFRDLKTGKKFAFFSLHFDHKGKTARAESAKMLVKKVAEISGGLPFFCVGDYNALPDSEPMKIIFAEKSFKDSLSSLRGAPESAGGTFHNFTGKSKTDRIDYIFVSEKVGVLSYAVIRDSVADLGLPANPKAAYPSDHFPVAVDAVLK